MPGNEDYTIGMTVVIEFILINKPMNILPLSYFRIPIRENYFTNLSRNFIKAIFPLPGI